MDLDPTTVAAALAAALLLALLGWAGSVRRLRRRLRDARSARQSLATRHGQVIEQVAPFLATWPYDAKRFRFLGSPVDGVQFTDDAVVFVEVKTQDGRLTPEQQRVKALVQAGRVRWDEVRIR